jgi:AcrR family transcriptional regulator
MISSILPTQPEPSARERILLTAHDLFYCDGVRATGIDKVIAEARVTKVTFYRHFPSKNDLIRAYLDYRHERWMNWFIDAINRYQVQQGRGLSTLVPVMEEWFNNPIYRGCAFINTVSELGGTLPDVIEISSRHKHDMVQVITGLIPECPSRELLANAAAIAVDGAIVKAQLESKTDAEPTALQGLSTLLSALESMILDKKHHLDVKYQHIN